MHVGAARPNGPSERIDQAEPITAASVSSSIRRTARVVAVSRADEYRRDREARIALSHMAEVWLRLADDYEDANGMVGQSKAAEEARPVVQQQQQIQPDD